MLALTGGTHQLATCMGWAGEGVWQEQLLNLWNSCSLAHAPTGTCHVSPTSCARHGKHGFGRMASQYILCWTLQKPFTFIFATANLPALDGLITHPASSIQPAWYHAVFFRMLDHCQAIKFVAYLQFLGAWGMRRARHSFYSAD